MRHTVLIMTRRGPEVLWDCDVPCPWNLRKVLFKRNQPGVKYDQDDKSCPSGSLPVGGMYGRTD